ncbi:hypothetical protein ACM66B_001480 [Microbotryomycetes sp. NB124-2]
MIADALTASSVDVPVPRDAKIESIASNPTLQEEIFVGRAPWILPVSATAVFAGSEHSRDKYSLTARDLAQILGLSEERAEYILRRRVPDFIEPDVDDEDDEMSASHATSESDASAYRTGKTTAVQHLADKMGKCLTALNLSNQPEAGALIGGYRPVDEAEKARRTAAALVNQFVELFGRTFNAQRKVEYVSHVCKAFDKERWPRLVGLWREVARMAECRIGALSTAAARGDGGTGVSRDDRIKRASKTAEARVVRHQELALALRRLSRARRRIRRQALNAHDVLRPPSQSRLLSRSSSETCSSSSAERYRQARQDAAVPAEDAAEVATTISRALNEACKGLVQFRRFEASR